MAVDLYVQDDNNIMLDISDESVELQFENEVVTRVENNYEELRNLPQINGVELIGDKTSEDLGISSEWYETGRHGLVHPTEAVWRDSAGSGLIFNQHNNDSVESPNYVMKDTNATCSAYALFLPNLTANLVESVPTGSTTYTLSSNLFVDGEDLSWVLDIPWAWERTVGAKLATSYTLNENNKVVLTFDESLNPTAATSKLLCGVKLNHSIYGGFFTGAALSLKGQSSFVGGLYVKNEGSQSFVNGRAIHNTGGRSGIIGEQIFNYADRAFIAGKNMQNEKLGSFLVGEGHIVDSNAKEEMAAFGTYSDIDTDTLFVVGNGVDKDNRSNAFEIKDTGDAFLAGDAIATSSDLSTKADSAGASANYAAKLTAGIPYGKVDSTSTSTAYTATVPGITELKDGVCVLLKNGVVTSAANFTIDINGLGAKGAYSNMATTTRETTTFNVNYTILFIYDENRVSGGCWVYYRGYYSDANSIGYQLRTNSAMLPASDKFYRYRLLFTSADGKNFVPANTSTSTNATTSRNPNQRKIDPFGKIVYYGSTSVVDANANVGATALWEQYVLTLGYSFAAGSALTMTFPAPVYLRCVPQTDGSAIIENSTKPWVQALPSTNDGYIYIFLGIAYSATNIELDVEHPVYYHDGIGIRLWTGGRHMPNPPSTDGTYTLQCTVSSGVATYNWI